MNIEIRAGFVNSSIVVAEVLPEDGIAPCKADFATRDCYIAFKELITSDATSIGEELEQIDIALAAIANGEVYSPPEHCRLARMIPTASQLTDVANAMIDLNGLKNILTQVSACMESGRRVRIVDGIKYSDTYENRPHGNGHSRF